MADLNRARQLIQNFDKIEDKRGGGYGKPGQYIVLINKNEMKMSPKTMVDKFYISLTVMQAICDGKGNGPESESFEGLFKGDNIQKVISPGIYFAKPAGDFLSAALDIDPKDAKSMSAADLQEMFIQTLTCDEQESGILDGHVCVQITCKNGTPKADPKDPTKLLEPFVNMYFDKRVMLMDLADKLDKADMERFFGSEDRFMTLAADEG